MDEQPQTTEPQAVLTEDPAPPPKSGFWRRQFSGTPTRAQKSIDLIFGGIVPVVLLIFDPIVFRASGPLSGVAFLAYLGIGLGIVALVAWLWAGQRLANSAAVFAGALIAGGLFSLVVGVVMLPLSLIGLIFCIGILGFIPFITAFVYFRNGVRAFRIANAHIPTRPELAALMLGGALLVLGVPALAQAGVAALIDPPVRRLAANQSDAEVSLAIEELRTANRLCLSMCAPMISAAIRDIDVTSTDQQRQINALDGELVRGGLDLSLLFPSTRGNVD